MNQSHVFFFNHFQSLKINMWKEVTNYFNFTNNYAFTSKYNRNGKVFFYWKKRSLGNRKYMKNVFPRLLCSSFVGFHSGGTSSHLLNSSFIKYKIRTYLYLNAHWVFDSFDFRVYAWIWSFLSSVSSSVSSSSFSKTHITKLEFCRVWNLNAFLVKLFWVQAVAHSSTTHT